MHHLQQRPANSVTFLRLQAFPSSRRDFHYNNKNYNDLAAAGDDADTASRWDTSEYVSSEPLHRFNTDDATTNQASPSMDFKAPPYLHGCRRSSSSATVFIVSKKYGWTRRGGGAVSTHSW